MNGIESRIQKCIYRHLIYDKVMLKSSVGKDVISTYGFESIGFHMEKNYLNTYLTSCSKINSRWTVDINIKERRVKLLEYNIEEYIHNLGIDKDFLYSMQTHTHTHTHTQSFLHQKTQL